MANETDGTMKRIGLGMALAAGLALASCGGGEDSSAGPVTDAAGAGGSELGSTADAASDAPRGAAAGGAMADAAGEVADSADDAMSAAVPASADSPDAAVLALAESMRGGDFLGAAQFTHPDSEAFGKLMEMADSLEKLRERAGEGDSGAQLAAALTQRVLTEPWAGAEAQIVSQEGDNALVSVMFSNGTQREYPAVLVDGQWLVNIGFDDFPVLTPDEVGPIATPEGPVPPADR